MERWHRWFFVALGSAILNDLAFTLFIPKPGVLRHPADPWTWVLAVLCGVALITRRLPLQNAIAIALTSFGVAWGALSLLQPNGNYGIHRVADSRFGPLLPGGVSVGLLMIWSTLAPLSRGLARLALHPWRAHPLAGAGILSLNVALTTTAGCGLERVASSLHWWRWTAPSPRLNSTGALVLWALEWGGVSFLIHLFTTPWWIDKRPVKPSADFRPLWMLVLLSVWIGVRAIHAATIR